MSISATDDKTDNTNVANLYAVHDSKADAFYAPFPAPNDQLATRWLVEMVNDLDTVFGKHPEDFTLYHIGYFDTKTGELASGLTRAITLATSCIRKDS